MKRIKRLDLAEASAVAEMTTILKFKIEKSLQENYPYVVEHIKKGVEYRFNESPRSAVPGGEGINQKIVDQGDGSLMLIFSVRSTEELEISA